MNRVFHNYNDWEDYKNGMWRKESTYREPEYLERAIEFTGDHILYGSWMLKVIEEWPIACEHNLTCTGMNRRAWVGHAAVNLAFSCPEYITRLAWWKLNKEQQDLANNQADIAIQKWEQEYAKKVSGKKRIGSCERENIMDFRHF